MTDRASRFAQGGTANTLVPGTDRQHGAASRTPLTSGLATDSATIPNAFLPTDTRLRVFLPYSRKDLAIAERLRDAHTARGFGAYLDKHDILPGEPWQERLAQLIETADTVVFPLSPDSVASTLCDWEVNEAEGLGG